MFLKYTGFLNLLFLSPKLRRPNIDNTENLCFLLESWKNKYPLDHPFKDDNVRYTMLPLKPMPDVKIV